MGDSFISTIKVKGIGKKIIDQIDFDIESELGGLLADSKDPATISKALTEELYLYRLSIALYILDGIFEAHNDNVSNELIGLISDEITREFAELVGWKGRVEGEYTENLFFALGERTVKYRELFYEDLVDFEGEVEPYFMRSVTEIIANSEIEDEGGAVSDSIMRFFVGSLPAFAKNIQKLLEGYADDIISSQKPS